MSSKEMPSAWSVPSRCARKTIRGWPPGPLPGSGLRNSVALSGSCACTGGSRESARTGRRNRKYFFISGPFNLHGFGVPVNDAAAVHADIREQGRSGCAEAKDRVFHHGRPVADGIKEIVKVVIAVQVAFRCSKFFYCRWWCTGEVFDGIFLAVFLNVLPLHGISES